MIRNKWRTTAIDPFAKVHDYLAQKHGVDLSPEDEARKSREAEADAAEGAAWKTWGLKFQIIQTNINTGGNLTQRQQNYCAGQRYAYLNAERGATLEGIKGSASWDLCMKEYQAGVTDWFNGKRLDTKGQRRSSRRMNQASAAKADITDSPDQEAFRSEYQAGKKAAWLHYSSGGGRIVLDKAQQHTPRQQGWRDYIRGV